MLKKLGGVILVIVGLFFSIATVKMIFVDLPKAKSSMKDAIYVGEDAIDEKNDGKIVIVCGEFELTQPSYDEELGISFDTIRAARTKQTLERTKNTAGLTEEEKENMTAEEKLYGILEWNTGLSEDITLVKVKLVIIRCHRILFKQSIWITYGISTTKNHWKLSDMRICRMIHFHRNIL